MIKRFMANYVVYRSRLTVNGVAAVDGNGNVDVTPFETETASTSYVDGVLAIMESEAAAGELRAFLRDEPGVATEELISRIMEIQRTASLSSRPIPMQITPTRRLLGPL